MPTQPLEPSLENLRRGRHIAAIGTENSNGSIHLTAVCYLFEGGQLFVATSAKSRKARNVMVRPKASLMVDSRRAGAERGVTILCRAQVISGSESREINHRLHSRYLSTAALSDPEIGTRVRRLRRRHAAAHPRSLVRLGQGGAGCSIVRRQARQHARICLASRLRLDARHRVASERAGPEDQFPTGNSM